MLKKEEIHFFNDIAYYHVPFTHCPTGDKLRADLRCHCNPKDNFDWKGYSCKSLVAPSGPHVNPDVNDFAGTARYFELNGMERPEGWEGQQD
jgi:alpha 1,2-mannosyltransferase